MDAIIGFFLEKFPVIAIIIVVVLIVWFIAHLYFVRFRNVEKGIENIPCASPQGHCTSISDTFNRMDAMLGTMNNISEDLKGIKYYLIRTDNTTPEELAKKCCPFQLTDMGWLLLEDSGAQKCIDDNLSYFIDEIKKMQPKVELDVEDYALSIVSESIKEDFFNEIKNFVFHARCPYNKIRNGKEISIQSPITLNNVLYVMSIYLRDKFLEKHPEYSTKQTGHLVEA